MDIQRLRNLTTGRLHTTMSDIYEDFEFFTGVAFLTHQLPRALDAILPILKRKISEPRFWDDKFDLTHVGTYAIDPLDKEELAEFRETFRSLPDPLSNLGSRT